MKILRNIIAVASITGAINLAYYNLLDVLPAPESTILMLGFVSLIVLPIGIYIGVRRVSLMSDSPLSFIQSMMYGMLITEGAAITVILLRILTTALSLSKYDSIPDYIASTAPQSTLFWYSLFGLVYCVGVHLIIRFQYAKTNK